MAKIISNNNGPLPLANNKSSKNVVSIVCLSFNQEEYIESAIQGFLSQITDYRLEIILADDASTDKTPEIINKYAIRTPQYY